ncbi:hypothetical protein E4U60_005517 [Claviceps pazoutovae]|uniref:CFEM domain-containing protein n=1 Tax=Claviceps pazoutovae TaxID=1649127 RepID=A0A9P7MGX2_9HYPO|nr:hypothetical protein E4U60_005517 [Claviceps pazoutovae]
MAGLVSAQNINDIPACAMPCMQTAVSKTVCSFTDVGCLCSKDNFVAIKAAATSCVIEKCGANKAASEVLPAVQKLCSAIGNTIENRPGGSGSSPSGSGAAAPALTEEFPHGEATPVPTEKAPHGEATHDPSGHHHSAPPAYSAPPSYSSAEGSMGSMATPTGASDGPEPSCEGESENGHGDAADMPGETGMPMPMPIPMPKNETSEHTSEHTGEHTTEHTEAPMPSSPVTAGAAGLAPMGVLAVMIAGALAL